MQCLYICSVCACVWIFPPARCNSAQQNDVEVLMKNISDFHFQLFSSIQKKAKVIKTAVFETQCSGSGCTFNGCESSGSDSCDRQIFKKLNRIQSSINNIGINKPSAIVCKNGWKRYKGHCYYYYATKMKWFEAQVFCRKQGTSLLEINDANENNWVSRTFPNVMYWIDYTDTGMEGRWVTFSTGKSVYSNWNSGLPDNSGGNEDCAYNNYSGRLGHWDDLNCSTKVRVMCEASGNSKQCCMKYERTYN